MALHTQIERQSRSLPVRLDFPVQGVSVYIWELGTGNWELKVTTYFTLEIQAIAVNIHVCNPDKRCPLFKW